MKFLIVGSLFVAGASAQLVHYPNGAVAPYDPNNAAATAAHLQANAEAGKLINPFGVHTPGWPSPSTTTARGRRRCLTPLPTWSPTPTVLLPPSTPMLLLPPPTTTPPRPPMATTPSLAPQTSTLLPLWCTVARSVRPRCLSTWSPVTPPLPISTPSLDTMWPSPLSPPPSPPTPTAPSCLPSPLTLSRPVKLTLLPSPRLAGRSARLRCL